jgi:hypothetical protein|tara:strand:+ start:430 stop:591 length:162 start_codon:yes stop_codon:yes gene_type:complete
MREVLDHQVKNYKQLRNDLNTDIELSDQEMDWLLKVTQESIDQYRNYLELELA